MLNRVLLDDEDFRLELGFFGGVTAFLKHRGMSRKAPKECADHLKATIDELERRGVDISPTSDALTELFNDFVEAIFTSPDHPRWIRTFGISPSERADEILR